jgi:hypothetical protein
MATLKQATFTITYSILKQSSSSMSDYTSKIKESYLSHFFENYESYKNLKAGSDFNGRYLIIATSDYESTITYFANYKRNIGYEVQVVNTDIIGTSNSDIKNYIQAQYNNISTRPDFVLLVGDHTDIPVSGGSVLYDTDDPTTDLHYSLLAGDDYYADVFLGRFSVSSNPELQNIINKTIYMDMNIHQFSRKAKFLAGAESNNWMENQFENGHDYVISNTFNPQGYESQKLYQPDLTSAVSALSDNPLFYIYSGHGSQASLSGGSFTLSASDIISATNTVFPFVFAFACHTGNFTHSPTCLGEHWIRAQNRGGVAYFGSSVETMTNSDKIIEEKIFGDAFTDEEYIAAITNLGMRRYWLRFWSLMNRGRTRRYMKAYNLLGDPSLNIHGVGYVNDFIFENDEVFNSGDVVAYSASNTVQNSALFEVLSGADVTVSAGNAITLKPGFKAETGSVFVAQIEPYNSSNITRASVSVSDYNEPEQVFTNQNKEWHNPVILSLFPNPITSDFSVSYTVSTESLVKFELYNVSGIKIKTLMEPVMQPAGNHYCNFSISDLAPGIYILAFSSGLNIKASKIIKL